MTGGRFTRPRAFPRPERPSPAALAIERANWRRFLDEALDHGQRAADGAAFDKAALWTLSRHAFGTGKTPFPVEAAAARTIAKAFADMTAALVGEGPNGPRRVALGVAIVGAAKALDLLLHDAAREAFAATTGRQFKDD